MTATRRGRTGRLVGQMHGLTLFWALVLAPAAMAQTAPAGDATGDAIGDILETPATGPTPAPAAAPTSLTTNSPPPAPAPTPAPAPDAKPVYVDEVGRTPDGPPTPADRTYEARLRASFASAQGMQGPLDGRWTLSAAGEDLYALQLVDKGGSNLEGAWRDMHRAGAVQGSGFLTDIARVGASLTFQFQPGPDTPALSASLTPTADGRWTGEMSGGGSRRAVIMRRD